MSDYKNPLWPNGLQKDEEGYAVFYPLGTNKVDITTITWPDGDELVSPFVYKNGKLVGFVDTKALTVSGSATTTMNYSHIEADFSSIVEGTLTVDAPNAVVKEFRWSVVESGDDNVIVTIKYKGCKTVADVKAVDPDYKANDIVDGVWTEGLADLTNGNSMFNYCLNLLSFSSDLSSLTDGNAMFYVCSYLTTFTSDLSSLTNGYFMFRACTALTSFSSDLSSLMSGENMFDGCKLDAPSVKNIIDTINASPQFPALLMLGIGCNNTTEDKDLFAQEVGYTDMTSLLATFEAKSWFVDVQYNGRPITTYNLRRPSEDTLPIFAKLEETEDYATHTSKDGFTKYRLNWFHETTGSTEDYTQFVSLEEAIETLNIKPIERN